MNGVIAELKKRVFEVSKPRSLKPFIQRFLIRNAGHNRATERHFVGVFEFAAKRHAACNRGDLHAERSQFFGDVKNGRFAFDGWADGQNRLADFAVFDAADEAFDVQFRRADAFDGRNNAAQNMIKPSKLARLLDGHDVADAFNDADDRAVAARVGANIADVVVADIVANRAVFDAISHRFERVGEVFSNGRVLFDEMQNEAQGRFFANARQAREGFDGFFEELGWKSH